MIFTDQKVEACIAQEESRYALRGAYFDAKDKHLIVTNGHILALVPCIVEDGDISGLIPARAIELARDVQKRIPAHERDKKHASVRVLKSKKVSVKNQHDGEETITNGLSGIFPNWKAVIPEWVKGKPVTCLSIGFLRNLLDALTSKSARVDGLGLWIKDDQSAVMVAPCDGSGFGVIMPMRNDLTAENIFAKNNWKFPEKPKPETVKKAATVKPAKAAKKKKKAA